MRRYLLARPTKAIGKHGFDVTTPTRAILDAAASGDASREMIRQSLAAGKSRGLITRREIVAALDKTGLDPWLHKALLQDETEKRLKQITDLVDIKGKVGRPFAGVMQEAFNDGAS